MCRVVWIFFAVFQLQLEAKVYILFPFLNEYEILKIHLEELYNYVDYFVIGESCETFWGEKKPYNFNNNQELYSKYLDKIIYIKIASQNLVESGNASVDAWEREHWQRNQLSRGLKNARPNDVIILADGLVA